MQISTQSINYLSNLRNSVDLLEKELPQIQSIFCSLNQVAKVTRPLLKTIETIFFHHQVITSFFYRIVGYCVVIKTINLTSVHSKWKSINLIAHLYAKQLEYLQKIHTHPLIPESYIYLRSSLLNNQKMVRLGDLDFNRLALFDKAKNIYLNQLDEGIESAETYFNLGYLLDMRGEDLQIKNKSMSDQDCYIKAIDLDPNMTAAYYKLASIISKEKITLLDGSSMTKKELCLNVLNLGPTANENEVYYLLATYLDKDETLTLLDGSFTTKKKLYLNAINVDPDNYMAYLKLAKLVAENETLTLLNGSFITKKELLIKVLDLSPRMPSACYALGLLLGENEKITLLDKSSVTKKELFMLAIDSAPRMSSAYYELGLLLEENEEITLLDGSSVTKKELFIIAIDLDPRMSSAYYELGLLLEENEEIILLDESSVTKKELFMRALEVDPAMPFASIIKQQLSKNAS